MTIRVVQRGQSAHAVYLFLVGSHMDVELCSSLGPAPTIVADDEAHGLETMDQLLSIAGTGRGGDPITGYSLIGYSMGCQRVRTLEKAGAHPEAVIAIDGTHANLPPLPWQIEIWRDLANDARRGRLLFVATHTFQTYVEHLKIDPYTATVSVLRMATGLPLAGGGPIDAPGESQDGDLFVYSYSSASIDKHAHELQQQKALPWVLRRHLAPMIDGARVTIPPPPPTLATGAGPISDTAPGTVSAAPPPASSSEPRTLRRGDRGQDVAELQRVLAGLGFNPGATDGIFGSLTEAALCGFQLTAHVGADGVCEKSTRAALASASGVWTSSPETVAKNVPRSDGDRRTDIDASPAGFDLGLAVLAVAREDVVAGIHETAHNDGQAIRTLYLDPAKIPPGSNWCAAAFWSWLRRACAVAGVQMPIAGSAGAQATMGQLKAIAGSWVTVAEARANPSLITAGMVPVWDRSSAAEPWAGHIGVTAGGISNRIFPTVEGNSGPTSDRVIEWSVRSIDDNRLFGFGRLDKTLR